MPIPVHLHVYDLSQGMARSLSPVLLGRQLDGVWHTAVVVAGKEWYFGQGISCGRAGATRFGTPDQVIHLGDTHLAPSDLPALIDDLRATYHAAAYRLLGRVQGGLNCNDFADDLAHLLVGTGIPAHITSLPAEVLATPFGAALLPMLGGVEAAMGGMREEGGAAPSAQPALAAGLEVAAGAAAIADAPAAAVEASGSPRAAATLAAETAAPTLAAAEDAVRAAAASAHPSDARAAFEDLVRREFDDALASGAASTPNEAAQVALERATAAVRARAG